MKVQRKIIVHMNRFFPLWCSSSTCIISSMHNETRKRFSVSVEKFDTSLKKNIASVLTQEKISSRKKLCSSIAEVKSNLKRKHEKIHD